MKNFTLFDVENILNQYKQDDEVTMIKNFCRDLDEKYIKYRNKTIKITAKSIHRKPIIVINPKLTKSGRLELGDLLFILKDRTFSNKFRRAVIFQVKKSHKDFLLIPSHQWEFYKNIELFEISFRNFNGKISPTSLYFLSFLVCYLHVNLVISNKKSRIKVGIMNLRDNIRVIPIIQTLSSLRFYEFILNFINGKIGENLSRRRNINLLIKELLRFVNIYPDPPEEYEKFYEDGEFGVVIFEIIE